MKRGKFINLAGPSAGAGKSTLIAKLLEVPELKLVRLSTYTTRGPRLNDPHDMLNRVFVGEKEFLTLKKSGFFIETKKLRHAWYGSPKDDIKKLLTQDKNVISDVDPQRINTFRRHFPDLVAIFVDAPNSFLRERMKERGEADQEIRGRLKVTAKERHFKKFYDKVFVNDQGKLDNLVNEIAKYIKTRLE